MDNIKKYAELFCGINQQINSVYEEYAKSKGLSYTSLYILHMISYVENCTQKRIAEEMFLPKQTINSVVTSFCKKGLVEMREMSEDRRHKTLHLTTKGTEYAKKILPKLESAEQYSLSQFSEEERHVFLQLMRKYADAFAVGLR